MLNMFDFTETLINQEKILVDMPQCLSILIKSLATILNLPISSFYSPDKAMY